MKAELKHIAPYLPFDLKGLNEQTKKTHGTMLFKNNKEDRVTIEWFLDNLIPIMHPLSNLIKEIEFEGEKFRPMFKLLQLVSGQKDILSETIEYSFDPDGKAYFIRVNYKGFFVILAYDLNDKSFRMIRNGKIFSINNQLEAFELLFKWHFNVYEVESIDK